MRKYVAGIVTALAVLWPALASAHLVNTKVGEFYAGMMHPVRTLEYGLPVLALALLASQRGKGACRVTLFLFPLVVMSAGFAGGRLPVALEAAMPVVLVGLGVMLIIAEHCGTPAVAIAGVLTGAILGYRCGNDLAAAGVGLQFIPGVALTGFLVVALVTSWMPVSRGLQTVAGMACVAVGLLLVLGVNPVLASRHGLGLPGEQELLGTLESRQLTTPVIVGALIAALIWGAGHALTPGHGKTIVAAYLIGEHATPWHAVYLGLVVTTTHTVGIFVLGLIALFASRYVMPEQLYPWLATASGLLVAGMGAGMLWRRIRTPVFVPVEQHHSHYSLAPHDHEHGHSHLPPTSWRSLLALGISGGILPCPAALVLLLGAVSLNRTAFGIVLVFAFSVGLAGVLTMVGLLFVKGSQLLQRVPRGGVWMRRLPVVSAVMIFLIGIGLTIQALAARF